MMILIFLSEAIEQNPIIYELMAEMGWRSTSFDLTKWVQDYARRRYGSASSSASQAWYTSPSFSLLLPLSLITFFQEINAGGCIQ